MELTKFQQANVDRIAGIILNRNTFQCHIHQCISCRNRATDLATAIVVELSE